MDNRAKAVAKYIKVAPRKARLAAALIRNQSIEEAEVQLAYCQLRAGRQIKKVLMSAVANAEIKFDAQRDRLHVMEVRVDEGPTLKRAKARSKGSRSPIMKRTSHLTVVVGEKVEEQN